jgi:hypothetical protein
MAIIFDPTNKRIILDSAFVTAHQIYSRWKEWATTGSNSRYLQALSVVGGDPLGGDLFVASYFFLLNGWRIRPMEANHILVIEGTITVAGGGAPVVPTLGSYNVSVQYTVPVQAQGIATGGSSLSAAEIALAVRAELAAELAKMAEINFTVPGRIDSNIKNVSDKPLKIWTGTEWA